MLEGIWGGAAITKSENAQLGIGADPTKVGGDSKTRLKSKMVLPSRITAASVNQSAKESAKIDAELVQTQKVKKHRLNAVNKLVQLHQIHADYSKQIMQADDRMQEIDADHLQEVASKRLDAGERVSYLSGWQEQMNNSARVIDI